MRKQATRCLKNFITSKKAGLMSTEVENISGKELKNQIDKMFEGNKKQMYVLFIYLKEDVNEQIKDLTRHSEFKEGTNKCQN